MKSAKPYFPLKENPSEAADLLKGLTKFEHLNIQWLVEEVIEQRLQLKKSQRKWTTPPHAPSSEMELVYDDPRGVRLYRSTVDTRWVLYQVDPRSGMPMQQELQAEEAEHVKRQLYGSPYWLIPMEQPQASAAPENPDLEMIYSDPNGIRIYETKSTGEWVLVRPDPMTGAPTPQKLTDVMRQSIKLQLGDSPYWTNGAPPDKGE